MSVRPLAILAALVLALALPVASAHATDPLLSGYAGPGGGEQVVLGGGSVGAKKGSSSGRAGTSDPGSASLKADTSASSPAAPAGASGGAKSTLTSKPQRKTSSSPSSKREGHAESERHTSAQGAAKSTTATTTTATLPGAPEVVAYPTRAGDGSGGLPISAAGIVLLVLGLAAATLIGLGLRRLSGSEAAQAPQVSGR
ncbi:MAG TPA: hypothetical protein VFG42_10775 [Baekduia sp.]|uniref:hypothetical protein n=1 Tax=Baekduia sp. TaxID=2600305 RepID=UPI002D7A0C75|nr:hypothetical protein [Baekduia sp.]HET6507264.1 hypothetical protein [Baekduia sp.]